MDEVNGASEKNAQTSNTARMIFSIICREIRGTWPRVGFKSGIVMLEPMSSDEELTQFCHDVELKQPYDPKQYPIQSTVVYLRGELDPTQSLAETQYHFLVQPQSGNKHYYQFPTFGHQVFAHLQSLFSIECEQNVWMDLIEHRNAKVALEKCGVPYSERTR